MVDWGKALTAAVVKGGKSVTGLSLGPPRSGWSCIPKVGGGGMRHFQGHALHTRSLRLLF